MKKIITHLSLLPVAMIASFSTAALAQSTVEYRNKDFDYYFVTTNAATMTTLDGLSGWERTGNEFTLATQKSGSGQPLYRFFFPSVARGGTRGSHFYTTSTAEYEALRGMNPTNASTPKAPVYEGVEGYAVPPTGQTCATGKAIYRAFRGNQRFPDDPNHRFVSSRAQYDELVRAGWDGEGVAFCVEQALLETTSNRATPVEVARVSIEWVEKQEVKYHSASPGRPESGSVSCYAVVTVTNRNADAATGWAGLDRVDARGVIVGQDVSAFSSIPSGGRAQTNTTGTLTFFGPGEQSATPPACGFHYRFNLGASVCMLASGMPCGS